MQLCMSKHASDFAGLPVDSSDENALLRAALADAQRRIGELEQRVESDSLTPLPTALRFRAEAERVVGLAERHGTTAAIVGSSYQSRSSTTPRPFRRRRRPGSRRPPALRPDPLDRHPRPHRQARFDLILVISTTPAPSTPATASPLHRGDPSTRPRPGEARIAVATTGSCGRQARRGAGRAERNQALARSRGTVRRPSEAGPSG